MSTRILLRHGQSEYNAGKSDKFDSDLTERGCFQIQEVALHVKEIMGLEWPCERPHDWIGFVSPYLRTLKTAAPVSKRYNVKMHVDYRIGEVPAEIHNYGFLPNRYADFPEYIWDDYPSLGMKAKRSMDEYYAGLKDFAKSLPEYAIIVSHLTPVRDLAEILTHQDLQGREVPNCSVTLIEDDELVFLGKR